MPSAEEMRARFERRVAPPGPTDEKLAVSLGLLPEKPANGSKRSTAKPGVVEVAPMTSSGGVEADGGGVGLEGVANLFPAPRALVPVAPGPPQVKIGFPVPVALMREVTRLKVDMSRHLARRLSNHEIGVAALALLPGDPETAAELLRGHAARVGLDGDTPPSPTRRLVALVDSRAAIGVEDLGLALEEHLGTRVTKSQLWALAHVLLLERAGR
ncbi:MAG: hypothetical protein ACRDV9_05420 [Acidimicrobiia bacterium]